MPAPIPFDAPVTTATFPASFLLAIAPFLSSCLVLLRLGTLATLSPCTFGPDLWEFCSWSRTMVLIGDQMLASGRRPSREDLLSCWIGAITLRHGSDRHFTHYDCRPSDLRLHLFSNSVSPETACGLHL